MQVFDFGLQASVILSLNDWGIWCLLFWEALGIWHQAAAGFGFLVESLQITKSL